MSAAMVILTMVWATEALPATEVREVAGDAALQSGDVVVAPGVAFYRKYTEGLLRRYVRLSMEAGRAPSLLGREMFRGNVTNYRVHGFDDVVIFVHDVERCVTSLDEDEQYLIRRIALQEYTQGETAEMLGMSLRTLHRRYGDALDRLTEIFLTKKLLEPQKASREGGSRW
jgi:predicted DNA-binding protein (UPF0251 family)